MKESRSSPQSSEEITYHENGISKKAIYTAGKQSLTFQLQEGEVISLPNTSLVTLFPEELLKIIPPITFPQNDILQPLTSQQTSILQLVADGYSTKEIANIKYLAQETVINHLKNIQKRLGIDYKTGAVLKGIQMGIIHLNDEH